MGGHRLQRIFFLRLALGAAQVAGEDEGSALLQKELQGGEGFLDPGIVRDLGALGRRFEGDIKVHPDEDLLAFGVEIVDGQLGHKRINLRCA